MKILLQSNGENVISISSFRNLIQYFGPFDKDISKRIFEVCNQKWFFGFESVTPEINCFNVRFSTSQVGSFTFCAATLNKRFGNKKDTWNYRIEPTIDSGKKMYKVQYIDKVRDYDKLIDSIKDLKEKHPELEPCSGSPFSKIFNPSKLEYCINK